MKGILEVINTPMNSTIEKVIYLGNNYNGTKKFKILNVIDERDIKMTGKILQLENDEVTLYNVPISETNVIAVKTGNHQYILHHKHWEHVLQMKMIGDEINLSLQEDIVWNRRVMRANLKLIHVTTPVKFSRYTLEQLEMACKMSMMMGSQNRLSDATVNAWWQYRKPAIMLFLDTMEKGNIQPAPEVKPDLTKQHAPTEDEGPE